MGLQTPQANETERKLGGSGNYGERIDLDEQIEIDDIMIEDSDLSSNDDISESDLI